MGLMDKLKAVKSNLTGDWANVTIQFEPVGRGGTLKASTTVTVKDQAISVEGVLIEVRCEEIIDIPNATVYESNSTNTLGSGTHRATNSEAVVTKETKVSGPVELAGGSSTTYEGEIVIPTTAPPTMQGRFARYEWQVRARVEMKGNDPDSGWQSFHVD